MLSKCIEKEVIMQQSTSFETLLNDNPKKYKYNPYPIYSEIVLLFLEFIEEIEHLQDIALLHEYFNRYLLAIC